ncbi:hypothetical protein ABZ348_08780 [Streptomyces sp. NPDC005963]|uniref:hypothetical protein n=1 Tax=Streptomyces sp. NPDC005963 TaxID=3156721 RepID=UPI0033F7238E
MRTGTKLPSKKRALSILVTVLPLVMLVGTTTSARGSPRRTPPPSPAQAHAPRCPVVVMSRLDSAYDQCGSHGGRWVRPPLPGDR